MEKAPIRSYRDLLVWQKSMSLVTRIYEITRDFPQEEVYCLSQQIRRCSVSVPSNIAEGFSRGSRKDYVHFLEIAGGSLYELQTQCEIAGSLNYISRDVFLESSDRCYELERMLNSLIGKLKQGM